MSWEEKLIKSVRGEREDSWPSHDFFHIQRVYNLCLRIGKKLDADVDLEILKAAALLHDVAYMKEKEGKDHAKQSAKFAESLLKQSEFPKEKIKDVVYAIRVHRFRNKMKPETLEAKILQDADRLDAIGAIGIARCFADSGSRNRILWDPKVKPKEVYNGKSNSAINHFYEKLLRIKDTLNLEKSRKITERRQKFMLQFLDEFRREWRLGSIKSLLNFLPEDLDIS